MDRRCGTSGSYPGAWHRLVLCRSSHQSDREPRLSRGFTYTFGSSARSLHRSRLGDRRRMIVDRSFKRVRMSALTSFCTHPFCRVTHASGRLTQKGGPSKSGSPGIKSPGFMLRAAYQPPTRAGASIPQNIKSANAPSISTICLYYPLYLSWPVKPPIVLIATGPAMSTSLRPLAFSAPHWPCEPDSSPRSLSSRTPFSLLNALRGVFQRLNANESAWSKSSWKDPVVRFDSIGMADDWPPTCKLVR